MPRFLGLSFLTILLLSSPIRAAGVDGQKMGLRAYGTGGFVGVASDAAAVAFNPAGLTNIASGTTQYEIGMAYVMLNVIYKNTAGSQLASRTTPKLPNAFIATATDRFACGLGLYAPLTAGSVNFKNVPTTIPGVGTASAFLKGSQGSVVLAPAVAYKISPRISVGLTMEIFDTLSDLELIVPALQVDAEQEAKAQNTGYDFKLGLFAKPVDQLSLGLQIKTQARIKYTGEIRELAGPYAGVYANREEITVPLYVIGGAAYDLTPTIMLNSDVGWRQWTHYRKQSLTNDPSPLGRQVAINTSKRTWDNTYTVSLGVTHKASDNLTVRSGMQWMPSAVNTKNATYFSTDKDGVTWSVGAELKVSDKLQLHAVFKHTWGLKRDLQDGGKGDFNSWDVLFGVTGSF